MKTKTVIEENDVQTPDDKALCDAPCSAYPCPVGFELINPDHPIKVGDLVQDEEGQWRGPVPHHNHLVGKTAESLRWKPWVCRPHKDCTCSQAYGDPDCPIHDKNP